MTCCLPACLLAHGETANFPAMNILLLPAEILAEILSHVKSAQTLLHLSLTCHRLYDFVEREGWRLFVLHRFPSIPTPPFWKDASHALTNLSRNWDRKSILVRPLLPSRSIWSSLEGQRKEKWSKPRKQTMDYQPIIDSFEVQIGSFWDSKREILAWSAGAEVVMRITDKGHPAHKEWRDSSPMEREKGFTHHHHKIDWITYRELGQKEGRDDITVLKLWKYSKISERCLVENMTSGSEFNQDVLIGRASGLFQLLRLSRTSRNITKEFATKGLLVRAADINHSNPTLIAACLGDTSISLYEVDDTASPAPPCSQIETSCNNKISCRNWCTRFVSNYRLAVGRGISSDIIHVYEVSSSGLSGSPMRTFKRGDRDKEPDSKSVSSTSVYALENLPSSSGAASGASGNVFLSGGYDGYIRLHDMRSPENYDAIFYDNFDDAAIFSLQMVGRERLVAGSGRHSLLRFFDLRMTGGRAYEYMDAMPASKREVMPGHTGQSSPNCDTYGSYRQNGIRVSAKEWNVFAHAQTPRGATRDSSVYSLSSPSPSSLSLYVGTQGSVMQMDFIDVMDRHPDPTFTHGIHLTPSGKIHVQKTWNPLRDGINISMIDCDPVKMLPRRIQRGIGSYETEDLNYDARWLKVKPWF